MMTNAIHTDPNRRHDFVLLFDVTDGNPNGDPDAGNMPRVDPETMQGLVTDVCLKRKVRNYVLATQWGENGAEPGYDIYVKERGILNREHQRAYTALQINVGEPKQEKIPSDLLQVLVPEGAPVTLPEGFHLEEGDTEDSWNLHYSGLLDARERQAALNQIGEDLGKKAKDLVSKLLKGAKSRKPTTAEVDSARTWMCQQYFDIRAFGAVMSTGVNCGQVRGPLQMNFARSIDPVIALDLAITRVAVTREEDANKERGMGRKALVPYGLYRAQGFFNAFLGRQTGFSGRDLSLFWEALQNMWDFDRSASRGLMACRGLYIFSHENGLGNAPAHTLFDRIAVRLKDAIPAPRKFCDYAVSVDDQSLPEQVCLTRL
jgi:CRISPR-associated protein Csd2